MDSNPYASPPATQSVIEEPRKTRFLTAVAGLFFGAVCGTVAGIICGGLTGFTYRSFNDLWFGAELLGVRFHCSSLLDFAIHYAVMAVLPFGIWGAVVGCAQGYLSSRGKRSVTGTITFCLGAMIMGCLLGVMSTMRPAEIIPHFWEGPFAGTVFGVSAGSTAWLAFRKRIQAIALKPADQQVKFILCVTLFILFSILVLFASLWLWQVGSYTLQVKMQFSTIGAAAATFLNLFILWKFSVSRMAAESNKR